MIACQLICLLVSSKMLLSKGGNPPNSALDSGNWRLEK